MSQEEQAETKPRPRRIFDLRLMIAGVFVVYGVALTVAGFFDTEEDLAKASGLAINLWTGLAMLGLGIFFLLWARFGRQEGKPTEDRDDTLP